MSRSPVRELVRFTGRLILLSGCLQSAANCGPGTPGTDGLSTLGETIPEYEWDSAYGLDGSIAPLRLADVRRDSDASRDWGPRRWLLFVSIPEW